jgi:hypothetical protein
VVHPGDHSFGVEEELGGDHGPSRGILRLQPVLASQLHRQPELQLVDALIRQTSSSVGGPPSWISLTTTTTLPLALWLSGRGLVEGLVVDLGLGEGQRAAARAEAKASKAGSS